MLMAQISTNKQRMNTLTETVTKKDALLKIFFTNNNSGNCYTQIYQIIIEVKQHHALKPHPKSFFTVFYQS